MAVARGLVAGRFKSDEAAYLERFGLNDLPFATTPNPAYAYAHPSMLEGLRQMRQVVIERSGLGMVSGEVGLGKTMLSRYVESDLSTRPWARALYFPRVPGGQRQTEASVMREVAHSLGLKRVSGNSSDAYYRAIAEVVEQKDASEGTTVIIIDDAHMLNASGVRALLRLIGRYTVVYRTTLNCTRSVKKMLPKWWSIGFALLGEKRRSLPAKRSIRSLLRAVAFRA